MQIVIDIPEKVNNRLRSFLGHGYTLRDEDVKIIADAIYNGQTELEALANTSNTLNALNCIDRQAAIDALKERRTLYCDNTPASFSELSFANKSRVDELDTAIATLVNLPPAQPEIIRCGECKHRDKRYLCDVWGEYIYNGEYYCGSGERREK